MSVLFLNIIELRKNKTDPRPNINLSLFIHNLYFNEFIIHLSKYKKWQIGM